MKRSVFARIIGINLAVLVVLAIVLRMATRTENDPWIYTLPMALLIAFMLLINGLFALFNDLKQERLAHLLSGLLVLLIGFGLCGAGAAIQL